MIALTLTTLSYALAGWVAINAALALPIVFHWLEGHVS